MKKITKLFAAATAAAALFASPAMATTYKFTVTCSNGVGVAQWNTGDIDPGKEYLRVATGSNNPNCSVRDYEPSDSWMPVTVYEGAPAVVQGIPLIGTIISDLLGF